jgi:hypothetical protein
VTVVELLRDGVASAGGDAAALPVHRDEVTALEAELTDTAAAEHPRVVVLFCHEQRPEVFALLERLGAKPLLDPLGAAGDR